MSRLVPLILACAVGMLHQPAVAQDCYVVGTWNLEHFGFGKKRGFPELQGERGLPPRTPEQLDLIAAAIRDRIGAKILVLNEINGRSGSANSAELEDLMTRLGPSWQHAIGKSGASQRVAVIWNSADVEELARFEVFVAEERIGTGNPKPDIFARDPLAMYFRFREGGEGRNDFLVVALHLASGQHQVENHDVAMERLRGELRALRGRNSVLPSSEDDILLAGDLNASPFDEHEEGFFHDFNEGNWKLLASGSDYPATRVNGSQIDYLIVTRTNSRQQGLFEEEIVVEDANVRNELANDGPDEFRRDYSDHFPVTTCIAVTEDTD